jgi:predicted RNase H-like HicB family nuclease
MKNVVIANATPLVSLCMVGHEDILRQLFHRVIIPKAVEQELRIADIPDLPHCSAFGATPDEALREVMHAKTTWLEAVPGQITSQFHVHSIVPSFIR